MLRRICFGLLTVALLAACTQASPPSASQGPDKLVLEPRHFRELRGWDEDNHVEALGTFLKSCAVFDITPDTTATGEGILLAPASVWKDVCRKAEIVPPADEAARHYFEEYFVPFLATNNGNPSGLVTGYYEPLLRGSLTQHRPFMYPIYGPPVPGTPAYTRSQIDLGILNGRAPVLAYVDDPVRLFFMEIQGSGYVELENGTAIHLGYAASNGLPYVAIGRVLVDKGIMRKEDVSMPSLLRWLYDHPNDMWQVMWENTSYVFFQPLNGDAVGTEHAPLTANRSLAVDPHYIPLGMPVYLDTVLPETPSAPLTIHRKLMVAQDTGGGVHGPVRGDIFFGFGPVAEQLAGRLKSGGEFTLLVPRAIADTIAQGQ
jgi:membrane-bound lytic murein transglycosylase A